MAENEILSISGHRANRWSAPKIRISNGDACINVFEEIQIAFYGALRRTWQCLEQRKIDPQKLFEAALTNSSEFREMIDQCKDIEAIGILKITISVNKPTNMRALIKGLLESYWERVQDTLQVDTREDSFREELSRNANQMLIRICRSLVKTPSQIPPQPRRTEPRPGIDDVLRRTLL